MPDFSSLPQSFNILIVIAIIILLIIIVLVTILSIHAYCSNGYIDIKGFVISNDQIIKKKRKKKMEKAPDEDSIIPDNQYSWEEIVDGVKELKQKVIDSNYQPTLLVGIGRGGAIISALLSGNLSNERHVPFIALERKYEDKDGMRYAALFDDVTFSKDLDRVLLIAGDVVTGKTADVFKNFLKKQGAKEIKFLVYVMVSTTNRIPDFHYIKTNNNVLKFPWMFSNDYKRDSRT